MPSFGKRRIAAVITVVIGVSLAVYAAVPTAHAAAAPPVGPIAQLQAQLDALQQQVNQQALQLNQQAQLLDQQAQLLATKQDQVNGTCALGQHLSHVNADGSIVCTGDLTEMAFVRGDRHLNAFEVGDAIAVCPDGMSAVGGGFEGSNVVIYGNRSIGGGWSVTASTNLLGGDFTAYGVCIRHL